VAARRLLVGVEQLWDQVRGRRAADSPPTHFRIDAYLGHGGPDGVVVRGRVLDDPLPSEPREGEGVLAAVGRTVRQFLTDELPGVPLRIRVGDAVVLTTSNAEGYFRATLHPRPGSLTSPWTRGTVELADDYRGLVDHVVSVDVRVPGPGASFGIVSDIDDTILETGVQRLGTMLRQTFTGSALTRTAFDGAAELYRDLARGGNPVFYVSSSPWNLHAFLVAFLRHRDFPLGPLLLRDLLGTVEGREQKHGRIREILELHPDQRFVLIGDSGEKDPEIYADIVREHPGRILAVYIREVRLDPADGRVEEISDPWEHDVPFVLAADSAAVRRHATGLGLLPA
jgi:phosphatidate phosphatase APP1